MGRHWPGPRRHHRRRRGVRLFEIKAARVIVDLLAEDWAPGQFAASDVHSLRTEFAAHGCRLVRPTAARIIARASNSVTPHPSAIAGKQLLLASLLPAIDALSAEIERIEAQMADVLANT